MIEKSGPTSIFRGTRGSGSIEISVPGAFAAVGFSGQQENPGASAAERGRLRLSKTIDEDPRERHDHSTAQAHPLIPKRFLSKQAEPPLLSRNSPIVRSAISDPGTSGPDAGCD